MLKIGFYEFYSFSAACTLKYIYRVWHDDRFETEFKTSLMTHISI